MTEVLWVESLDEFDDILASNDNVVVKFTAPSWCIPCQRFAPHFSRAAEEVDGITFVAVDVDKNDWATYEYGIRGVPTVKQFIGDQSRDIRARTVLPLIKEITNE